MKIFLKDLIWHKMSIGCRGTALKSKHNLPSSVGSGCVWQFLQTPSLWTWKVIFLVLILVWAWQFGFHQVSATANGLRVLFPIFVKKGSPHFTQPWAPLFTLVNLHCFQWSAWLCIWLRDFRNQRGLCTSKSFARWCQAARKPPGSMMGFLSLWSSSLPVAPGFICYLCYFVYLSHCETENNSAFCRKARGRGSHRLTWAPKSLAGIPAPPLFHQPPSRPDTRQTLWLCTQDYEDKFGENNYY